MGQINTNNYPTVDSLADTDLLIVENATHGTGTTTPKQLRENAIGTDPLQTTAQTVTGAINELKNSGGDTVVSKKRYTISASGWSNDTTSDGYYYYNLSLTTALSSLSPNIYVAGTNAASNPTDTEQLMYSYLDKATMANSTIYLYAKTKPTSTFYITVMGVVGSNSGNVACNVIKPNGAHDSLPSLTDTNISSPTNGQVLGYNSTSGKWENQNPSGSGNTKIKTLYYLDSSRWSSAVNSDGYYTYAITLNPTLDTNISPDVLIAGNSYTSQPTDTHKTMFSYVERCYLSGSSLTLYAKTKPTDTFYIWVEGVAGSGSSSIVGNVIQPNRESRVLTLIGTVPMAKTSMTYDSTDDSYTGDFYVPQSLQNSIVSAEWVAVKIIGYSLDTNKQVNYGTTFIYDGQPWQIGSIQRDKNFIGCLTNTPSTGCFTHLYPRIKKWYYDYKITDSLTVAFYKLG